MEIRFISFVIVLNANLLVGCNGFRNNMINLESNAFKDSKKYSMTKIKYETKLLRNKKDSVISTLKDSLEISKISQLYYNSIEILSYMDSLNNEIEKLDSNDPHNVKVMNDIFLSNGIADTLYFRFNSLFELSKSVAFTKEQGHKIMELKRKNLHEDSPGQFRKMYFQVNDPHQAIYVLLNFESELLITATESLQGYN